MSGRTENSTRGPLRAFETLDTLHHSQEQLMLTLTRRDSELIAKQWGGKQMHTAPSTFREISDRLEQSSKGWEQFTAGLYQFSTSETESFLLFTAWQLTDPWEKQSHLHGGRRKRQRERECKIQEQAPKRSRGGMQMDQSSIYTHRGLQTHWDYREARMPPKTHVTGLRQNSPLHPSCFLGKAEGISSNNDIMPRPNAIFPLPPQSMMQLHVWCANYTQITQTEQRFRDCESEKCKCRVYLDLYATH